MDVIFNCHTHNLNNNNALDNQKKYNLKVTTPRPRRGDTLNVHKNHGPFPMRLIFYKKKYDSTTRTVDYDVQNTTPTFKIAFERF